MTTLEQRENVVRIAKSLVNTPYVDNAMVPHCGMDCATFPMWVYSEAGYFVRPERPPLWSPQQWLKKNHRDTQYEDWIRDNAHAVEITEAEVAPGDLVIYRVVSSFTHGAIVIEWPNYVLHPIKGRGVIGSHGINEGFIKGRQKKFFRLVK